MEAGRENDWEEEVPLHLPDKERPIAWEEQQRTETLHEAGHKVTAREGEVHKEMLPAEEVRTVKQRERQG